MPSNRAKVRELRWPALGVVRRESTEGRPEFREPFPTPWAINCRPEDPLQKRLRGGSRPGLTAYATSLESWTTTGSIPIQPPAVMGVAPVVVHTSGVPSTWFLSARGPEVYAVASGSIVSLDPSTGAATSRTPTAGHVPTGCTHGCIYRDRIMLGGEHVYASRQGNLRDWDFGADAGDSGRATILQLSEAGEVGDTVTALMPFMDSSMIAATAWSLWLLQGDPVTGSLRNLSRGVGVISPRAWCHIRDGRVGDTPVRYAFAFLSQTGLFMIAPSGDGLQSLSEDRLPLELQDIPSTTSVSLVYSPGERGIYIFQSPASGTTTQWFFDMVTQGFWPFTLSESHQPVAACWYDGDVILYCKDGSLRYVGGTTDAGTAIDSYVLVGPIRVSAPDSFGIVTAIHGMIGASSGNVAWRIITGDTAEEACANGKLAIEAYQAGNTATAEGYAKAAGTWQAGRSLTRYPRVKAMWMCVLLKASAAWAYESMTIESRDAGRWR